MRLTPEQVSARFDADEIVGGSAKVAVSGAGGGEGFGGVGPDTYVATSSGVYGRLGDIQAAKASAVAAADEVSGTTQAGGSRRSRQRSRRSRQRSRRSRQRSRSRHRKTQKGGKRSLPRRLTVSRTAKKV